LDSLRGSSVKIGTIKRRLAWPLCKDDTHKSRSVKMQVVETDHPYACSEDHPEDKKALQKTQRQFRERT